MGNKLAMQELWLEKGQLIDKVAWGKLIDSLKHKQLINKKEEAKIILKKRLIDAIKSRIPD